MKRTLGVRPWGSLAASVAVLLLGCGNPPTFDVSELEGSDVGISPSHSENRDQLEKLIRQDRLTLAEVLEIAGSLNPQLESERRNIDLALASGWDAGLYPNPTALLEVEDYKTGGSFGDSKRTVGVGLPLVVSGRLGLASDLARKQQEASALKYVWRRREVLTEVKRAFANLLAAEQSIVLARETRDIARSLQEVTTERFKARAVPEMEVLKADVNLARSESELRSAERHRTVAVKELHALMGNATSSVDRFTGTLTTRFSLPPFDGLKERLDTAHPLVEEAARLREAAELDLSLAKSERFSDPVLEFGGGLDGEGDSIVQGGLAIPLPLFTRNQGRVRAAEIRIRQAELHSESVRSDLLLRLTQAYQALAAANDRVSTYRGEILPKAEKALTQTNEGHRLGKLGYLDVLDAQRTLSEARSANQAALTDLNLAALEVEKLTGLKLDSVR